MTLRREGSIRVLLGKKLVSDAVRQRAMSSPAVLEGVAVGTPAVVSALSTRLAAEAPETASPSAEIDHDS